VKEGNTAAGYLEAYDGPRSRVAVGLRMMAAKAMATMEHDEQMPRRGFASYRAHAGVPTPNRDDDRRFELTTGGIAWPFNPLAPDRRLVSDAFDPTAPLLGLRPTNLQVTGMTLLADSRG